MRIRSEDWLAGAACHTARPERAEAPPVRLSDLQPEQKRELASFGLAAVASCAFLVTPLILMGDVGPELPSTALAIQLVSAPRVASDSTIVVSTAPRSGVTRRARTGDASLHTARAARAAFSQGNSSAAQPVATSANQSDESIDIDTPEQEDAPQASGRVLRGVSRVLFGDGRHRVRPFPTPIAEQN